MGRAERRLDLSTSAGGWTSLYDGMEGWPSRGDGVGDDTGVATSRPLPETWREEGRTLSRRHEVGMRKVGGYRAATPATRAAGAGTGWCGLLNGYYGPGRCTHGGEPRI